MSTTTASRHRITAPTPTPRRADRAPTASISAIRSALDALLQSTVAAATAYDRPDLVGRLERAVARHADRQLTVLVAGEFKQGKSTLVNALLNAHVCGVADDVSTAVPTAIRHGADPAATVTYRLDASGERRGAESIEIAQVAELGTEQGNPGNREAIESISVTLPRKLLEPEQ